MLFLGASLIPSHQGIIIACSPKDVKGSGNSFSIFFINLFSYFPAPFVYGFLKDLFDDKNDPTKGSIVVEKFPMWTVARIILTFSISTIIRSIKSKIYDEKMGRDITKKKEEKNFVDNNDFEDYEDEGTIRLIESSLDNNKKEIMNI